jgi:hypothetical protein
MSKLKLHQINLFAEIATHKLIFVNNASGEIFENFLPKHNEGSIRECQDRKYYLQQLYPEYNIIIDII